MLRTTIYNLPLTYNFLARRSYTPRDADDSFYGLREIAYEHDP
jgi:hypothetical protein